MEPLGAHYSNLGTVSPTALQADLASVLQQGRALAGFVLQSFGRESLLVGIGRHRVPAESLVDLEPDRHFLFRPEHRGGRYVLRVLNPGSEEVCLAALRSALIHAGELCAALERLRRRGRPGTLEGALPGFVFDAEDRADSVRRVLESLGYDHEASLLAKVLAEASPRTRAAWAGELLDELIAATDSTPEELRQRVLRRGVESADSPDDLSSLAGSLQGRMPDEQVDLSSLPDPLRVLLLERLFGRPVTAEPAQHEPASPGAPSLKSHLLAAQRAEGGEEASDVRAALDGFEAEQILNRLRTNLGTAPVWCLPFRDDGAVSSAHLSLRPLSAGHRLSLWISTRRLGAVRAELVINPSRVALRLLVVRPEAQRELEERAQTLTRRLAGEREAACAVVLAPIAEVEFDPRLEASSLLAGRPLMDCEG